MYFLFLEFPGLRNTGKPSVFMFFISFYYYCEIFYKSDNITYKKGTINIAISVCILSM